MFVYEIQKKEIDSNKLKEWLKNKNYNYKEYPNKIEVYFDDYYLAYSFDKFIKSVKYGFSIEDSEKIFENKYDLVEIDLKRIFKRKVSDRKRTVGRIIGEKGSILKKIEEISNCKVIIKNDRYIYLLGDSYSIDAAIALINKLIQGSPHDKVIEFGMSYMKYLEKKKKEEKSI